MNNLLNARSELSFKFHFELTSNSNAFWFSLLKSPFHFLTGSLFHAQDPAGLRGWSSHLPEAGRSGAHTSHCGIMAQCKGCSHPVLTQQALDTHIQQGGLRNSSGP